jgi:Protein of unknown function (DUF1566)
MKMAGVLLSILILVMGLAFTAQARLVDMHDGTVYETDTQLSWLKDLNAGGYVQWSDAKAWVESLNANGGFAGLTGWRFPYIDPDCVLVNWNTLNNGLFPCVNSGRDELRHLYFVSLGAQIGGEPTANFPIFTGEFDRLWTGIDWVLDPSEKMAFGSQMNDNNYYPEPTDVLNYAIDQVLPVRAGARSVPPSLIDMHDGTIYDTDTQLSWLKDAGASGIKNWSDAEAWAESLNANGGFAGLTGWRLPSADRVGCPQAGSENCVTSELGHLYFSELNNPLGGTPTNSGPFSNLTGKDFWTGTLVYATIPCDFNFELGFQECGTTPGEIPLSVWAVRPGARAVPAQGRTPVPASRPIGITILVVAGLAIIIYTGKRHRAS